MGLIDTLLSLQPSLLWPMNHASGLPQDVSGNGRHATNTFGTVTPVYARSVPAMTGARTPQSAAAVSNGYGIAAASTPSQAAGNAMSYVMWGVLNATPTTPSMLMGRRKASSLIGGMFYLNTTRNPTLYYLASGTNPENYAGLESSSGVNYLWPVGQLTMFAATVDASNVLKMFVNGAQMGFDFWSDGVTDAGYMVSATLGWRNNGGDYFMAGGGGADTFGAADFTYGPVGVWNRALTANEIAALYAEGIRGGVVL